MDKCSKGSDEAEAQIPTLLFARLARAHQQGDPGREVGLPRRDDAPLNAFCKCDYLTNNLLHHKQTLLSAECRQPSNELRNDESHEKAHGVKTKINIARHHQSQEATSERHKTCFGVFILARNSARFVVLPNAQVQGQPRRRRGRPSGTCC